MSSPAQVKANRANAQHSTGPRTQQGQTVSKANAVSHGLRSSRETLFAAHPVEQQNYDALQAQLRAELFPTGPAEDLVFDAYAFASFQVQRAQSIEVQTHNHFLENPENHQAFLHMERAAKLGALYERRAAKSLDELRKLQTDRLAAAEISLELNRLELPYIHSRALPFAMLRKKALMREDPVLLGLAANAANKTPNKPQNQQNPDEPNPTQEAQS